MQSLINILIVSELHAGSYVISGVGARGGGMPLPEPDHARRGWCRNLAAKGLGTVRPVAIPTRQAFRASADPAGGRPSHGLRARAPGRRMKKSFRSRTRYFRGRAATVGGFD